MNFGLYTLLNPAKVRFHTWTLAVTTLVLMPGSKAVAQDSADFSDAVEVILARIQEPVFRDAQYNVVRFGAVGDGATDCLPAFKACVTKCNKEGGGTVQVPEGTWLLEGPLHLLSNVQLHISDGATLMFTDDTEKYLPQVLTRWEGTELYNYSPLIYAYQATNVAISGGGTIDGNASEGFARWKPDQRAAQQRLRQMGNDGVPVHQRVFGPGDYLRPSMIQFFGCSNVLVSGITIIDAPFWVIHPVYSDNVIVRGVTVNSWNKNNDGCDPDASVDVLIENCTFKTGDDGIAIKAGRDQDGWRVGQPTENVVIRHCRIGAVANGICIGSEMSGGVRNVYAENCHIDSAMSTIYVKSNLDRGGIVENFNCRNIQVDKAKGALIRLETNYKGHRGNHYPPAFRTFTFENLRCAEANVGVFAEGHPESLLEDIVIKDLIINKVNIPFFVVHFSNFLFENVHMAGSNVAAHPPGNMKKPGVDEMGW
jgi:polygalacturonase